jgi:hypothetical protein
MAKGDDARVRTSAANQQNRYESQQGPVASTMAFNYGRGSEANYGDYTDIMNRYRTIAGGGGASGGGSAADYGAGKYTPFTVGYSDPFESYGGFKEFSQTGGYSKEDIANMRSRGVSPVRAAYANAEREMGRQRSLQGGYSPNFMAASAKMARERGQAGADAMQNVEAGLAEARNKGRLSGLTGMSGIEGQRLNAQIDVGKFNAEAQARAQAQNIGAESQAAGAGAAASAANRADQLRALSGMTSLYGTNPGMSETFGNQVGQMVGQGGNFGLGMLGAQTQASQIPGKYETTMGRIGDVANMAYPWLSDWRSRTRTTAGGSDSGGE